MRRFSVAVLCVLLVGLAALAGSASAATVTQVTSGLDSPRGLAFLRNGTLAVAEAGHGGDLCLGDGGAPPCFGLSSQVSTVDAAAGTHKPLVGGLISLL